MPSIKRLGIDLGKSNFHLIGLDATESTVYRKKLSRPKFIEFIAQLEPCTMRSKLVGWLENVYSSAIA
jgi:transposase